MPSPLRCSVSCVVLLSLASSTLSFSRGATRASCRQMIPGHISAHPLDPQHSHITLRTSAASYLPGQLLTVTVRSSRDFMGFLLQARSVEGVAGENGVEIRAENPVGEGVRSMKLGPVLMGGSWTVAPPGTHRLRCFSDNDTLTHSDKQLKRNLSFVWRAPDAPMGDFKFYITVVQSYFVYWAGVESSLVRDGSHGPRTGNNITVMDRRNAVALQEDEVTALAALRANTLPKRQRKTASASAILRPPATTNSATQGYRSQETPIKVTHPVLEMNRSDSLASFGEDYLENQAVDEGNGSLQNVPSGNKTDIYGTSGLYLGTDPGSPDTLRAPSFSAEARGMKSTTHLPNITVQDSKSPLSLVSLSPLTDGHVERKEANVSLQDPKWSTVTGTKDTFTPEGTTSAELSRSLIFHHTDPTGFTSQNPGGSHQAQTSLLKFVTQGRSSNIPTESRTSLIKDEAGSQSVPQAQNPEHGSLDQSQNSSDDPPKSPLQLQTVKSQIFPFYEASSSTPVSQFHTSSPHLIVPSNRQPSLAPSLSLLQPLVNKSLGVSSHYQPTSDLFKRLLENSPSELTTRQTSQHQQFHVTLTSSPQSARRFPQTFPQTTKAHAGIYHTHQRRPDKPPTALNQPSFQPRSQTTPSQPQTLGWKQSQPSAVPQSILPWLFTSRFDHTTPGKKATAKIATTSPIVASTPRVDDPPFPVSTEQPTLHSSSHPSTHNMLKTSYLYHGRSSTMASIKTSFTHKSLSTPPSSSTIKKQPKTSPAIYALPSSSPISTPPLVSSLSPAGTLSSSTKPSFYSSLYSLLVPLSTSSSSPFTTSQYVTSSPFSPTPSFISSPSSAPHSSHSFSSISGSTSVSSFSTVSSSTTFSSLVSSGSTSPHPELSPVPRQFLYHLLTSTISPVASQQLTVGQRLQIQNHATPSEPWPKLNLPTPRTMVHPNPEPHPNLDPNFKLSADQKLNPSPPNTAVKPKHPSNPSKTPEKEGKYPDIVPKHNTWEVGLVLGCSAGLGMVLVAGLRYMYTQVCGKRTQVTLNDREREYSNRERGLIHVQECGDLVRVRRIRDNSFVLLAEYDILASPGD